MRGEFEAGDVNAEVEDEFAFHLEMRVRELIARGWSEDGARAEAIRRFGDIDRVKDDCRELGRGRDVKRKRQMWWDGLRQDVGFALRQLRKRPSFAIVAIATLALAIGANAAVFSVINGVVLKPLNFPESDKLVRVWTRYLPPSGFDIPAFALSVPEYLDYVGATESYSAVGAFGAGSVALTGDGTSAEQVRVGYFTSSMFDVLGVPALHGRGFNVEEDVANGARVVVLSHELFQTRFGGDPAIVGRSIQVDGRATEVVGVMPSDFEFFDLRAFMPYRLDPINDTNRAGHGLAALGRLAPGATIQSATAELDVLNAGWGEEHEHNAHHFLWVNDFKSDVIDDAPRTLGFLLAAVGLVLLIACANVANLLLARGERRQAEVSVRTALGAGRSRIVRQLLTESVVLAVASSGLGLLIAKGLLVWIIRTDPGAIPRLDAVQLDGMVFAFTGLIAISTALVFGTLPAFLTGRAGMASIASATTKAIGSRHGALLRRGLVAAEVGLAVVVVLFAGLMVRSLNARLGADPGFEPDGTLAVDLSLPRARYGEVEQYAMVYEGFLERIRAIPGVTTASVGGWTPFAGGITRWDFQLDDRPPRQDGDAAWNASITWVSPGYFETLGIPVTEGRGFQSTDVAESQLVGVVSQSMAERYWPGESAIGKRWGYLRTDADGNEFVPWITIVGVVPDQYRSQVDEDGLPGVYVPHAQAGLSGYFWPGSMTMVMRTGVDPTSVFGAVRAAVAELDPDLPVSNLRTLEETLSSSTAEARLVTGLIGSFGGLALLLALVGIYGVVSYSVAGRTREIGVRVALGAERGRVARMIVSEATRPLLLGITAGLLVAFYATGALELTLFGVEPRDPLTFAVLPIIFGGVGLLASVLPALRATAISPTDALRQE